MKIDARVLWALLLAWITFEAIRGPTVSSVGGALMAYGLAYMSFADPGPYESIREVPARDVPHIVSLTVGLILFTASMIPF